MTPPNEIYPDERLRDDFSHIYERLNTLEKFLPAIPKLEAVVSEIKEDARTCLAKVEALAVRQEHEKSETRKERKKDMQWLVGTIIGSAALIVGALALILG